MNKEIRVLVHSSDLGHLLSWLDKSGIHWLLDATTYSNRWQVRIDLADTESFTYASFKEGGTE